MDRSRNRKLLVSVFNTQEAREAVVGGARIVDSEDPRSALGNIKPLQIRAISRAVLDHKRDRELQLSTNIGEDQLLFDRSVNGLAVPKSIYEIAGKAAQAAIGVAISMGTSVQNCPIVKVGVDGMNVDTVRVVLREIVETLRSTPGLENSHVMSVLFAQDLDLWDSRKGFPPVQKSLIGLGEFHYSDDGGATQFDLRESERLVRTLRDPNGRYLFERPEDVPAEAEVVRLLVSLGLFPAWAKTSSVALNELFPHADYFPDVSNEERRTTREVIKNMVDVTKEAGANSIMLDTRIQSKAARVSLTKTSADGLVDINSLDQRNGIFRDGVLPLDDLRFFVDYCHHSELEANLAGSFQSFQAQQVWLAIPTLDQISTRGGSSAVQVDPSSESSGADSRQYRVTNRNLVRGLVPPEQGGILNIPNNMRDLDGGDEKIEALVAMIREARSHQQLPEVQVYEVDRFGNRKAMEEF